MLSKSNKGALSEYRVAVHLLANGWSVYRNMTPNGSVDLVIQRRGHLLKTQVKSIANGNGGNPKHLRQGNNDVLAVVGPDHIIFKVRSRRIQRLFPGSILARLKRK
jgi:Holliday junction resolvase